NEARFFKFWSSNQKPNVNKQSSMTCQSCYGRGGCPNCIKGKVTVFYNPLLEEYIDTIHFTLSIANDLGYTSHTYTKTKPRDLNDLVIGITNAITVLSASPNHYLMESIFNNVIALGYQLGFTEADVIAAYHDKNAINHRRQDNNY